MDYAVTSIRPSSGRVDTEALLARVDLIAVATNLMGPPPGRRGARGCKLWWSCPLHAEANPSFCIEPGKGWWKCFGCGRRGTAIDLMTAPQLAGLEFLDACRWLAEFARLAPEAVGLRPAVAGGVRFQSPCIQRNPLKAWAVPPFPRPLVVQPIPPGRSPVAPGGPEKPRAMLDKAEAHELVGNAQTALWGPGGAATLAMLHARGLTDATIRAAGLGWTDRLDLPGRPRGLVIPWIDRGRLTLVKLRPPDGDGGPKYREVFRDSPSLYVAAPIHPGRPLIVVEGEVDALTVAQEAGEWAGVATFGSASGAMTTAVLARLMTIDPWLIATDADDAGDRAAAAWMMLSPSRCRRVRPPDGAKDWNALHMLNPGAVRCLFADRAGGPAALRSVLGPMRWGGADGIEDEPPGVLAAELPPEVPEGWTLDGYLAHLAAGGCLRPWRA